MKTRGPSIQQMIEQQVQKWQFESKEKEKEPEIPVITISREPGSGGRIIAKKVAERLGLDLYYQEVIHEMAENAQVSATLVETLDEKGLNVLDEWITSLVDSRHLWPDQYMQHLMKVVGTIGKHGKAVIVGRGSNFILPEEIRFRVRIIAPLDVRAKHIARTYSISIQEAERRAIKTESGRKASIRKYFNADITDPINYDLVINTGTISIDKAVDTICTAIEK
ncbi:MAG: cytidylate kinase-like family protein [Desulfobacterales bacterium]|nr:cytidylate kinase-like family protein [Desulfobacterales bacterium]